MSERVESRGMMICERFENALLEAPRPAGGEELLDDELREHTALCPRCASLLADVEEMQFLLGELASTDAKEELPRGMEARLVAEFRNHRDRVRRPESWQVAAVAAAAVVLIALGIAAHRFLPHRVTRDVNNATVTVPAQQASAAANDDSVPSGDAVSFIALPYGEDASAEEDGAIVRVLMPRATLASLGIPVADITEDRVPAEVVLGEDGTPQAIRLIAQDRESEF